MAAGRSMDVQTFLDEQPFSTCQWLIFALCFLVVLLDGFDTAAIGYIAPSLIAEWGVARPALAPVLSTALFGLAAGALSAGPLADRFGRKAVLTTSVLVFGGAAPLVLSALLFLRLPESVSHMVAKRQPAERIRYVLRRISARADDATAFAIRETPAGTAAGGGIGLVLSRPCLLGSVMLWVAYFMGLVIFYALVNWMPVLFRDAGLEPRAAALISALFPLGGVGAILFGWLMDRFNGNKVIAIGFALTAAAIYAIGQATGSLGLLVTLVFLGGTPMNTAQSSLPALAAAFYPTQGRATGVAWMLGLGRFGGIAGSFLVAELTRRQLAFGDIFAVVALPGLVSAAALLVKQAARPDARPVRPAPPGAALGH